MLYQIYRGWGQGGGEEEEGITVCCIRYIGGGGGEEEEGIKVCCIRYIGGGDREGVRKRKE